MNAWILIIIILLLFGLGLCFWYLFYYYCGTESQGHEISAEFEAEPRINNQVLYEKQKAEKLEAVRRVQEQQMQDADRNRPEFSGSQSLIIGVDARPTGIGGYCIDLEGRTCEYYALGPSQLPWALHDKSRAGDSAEFEMKNLLFALHLWEERILGKQTVQIYTDNSAVLKHQRNQYGQRVDQFVQHFKRCEGVKLIYTVASSERMLEQFARFIQPADDLSRGQRTTALGYLKSIYHLDALQGAYSRKDSSPLDPNNFLLRVKNGVRSHSKVF